MNLFKRAKLNSFVGEFAKNYSITVFFTMFYNLIQLFIYRFLGGLNDELFADISFAVYIMTFYEITNSALLRHLIKELSNYKNKQKQKYLMKLYKSVFSIWIGVLTFLTIIFTVIYPNSFIVILICFVKSVLSFVFMIPTSLAYSFKLFSFLGASSLLIPFFRLTALYISPKENITVVFLITSVFVVLIKGTLTFFYISWKYRFIAFRKFLNGKIIRGKNFLKDNITEIVFQILIAAFWIIDGIFLKRFLSNSVYAQYSIYATVLRPPLYLSLAAVNILLSKSNKNSSEFLENINLFYMLLIFIIVLFIAYFTFNEVSDSLILKILGFWKKVDPSLMLTASVSWCIHTSIYITNLVLSKLSLEKSARRILVLFYIITYLITLWSGRENAKTIYTYTAIQGVSMLLLIFIVSINLKSFKRQYIIK